MASNTQHERQAGPAARAGGRRFCWDAAKMVVLLAAASTPIWMLHTTIQEMEAHVLRGCFKWPKMKGWKQRYCVHRPRWNCKSGLPKRPLRTWQTSGWTNQGCRGWCVPGIGCWT